MNINEQPIRNLSVDSTVKKITRKASACHARIFTFPNFTLSPSVCGLSCTEEDARHTPGKLMSSYSALESLNGGTFPSFGAVALGMCGVLVDRKAGR